MLTLGEILEYIDEIIDDEADLPKNPSELQREVATGVILRMEDLKDWFVGNWGTD